MEAIILAGGFGTRIKEVFPDIPKPLIPINGVPFLDILLTQLSLIKSIDKVILAVGYKKDVIKDRYKKRSFPFQIQFSDEIKPLGTGGAIKRALNLVGSDYALVLNGDSYLDFNCNLLLEKHLKTKAYVTLSFIQIDNASRYGSLNIDESEGKILEFQEKKEGTTLGYINGGVYILDKKLFTEHESLSETFSMENDLFPLIAKNGKMFGVLCSGTFIDIGTKDSYFKAQTTLRFLTDDK